MIKKNFIVLLFLFTATFSFAQANKVPAHPKLIVGLVIDQMRWDYLYRYYNLYSENGFKRLINNGFSCENTFIPYVPTYTAPGHTCIYTGSVPAIHGIVANDWYDKTAGKNMYCTDDSIVSTVGSNSLEGKMSPRNLWVTTLGDELRLSNNFSSKVIGIAIKDRASILPAGHTANAAYWFDASVGKWITSSYYEKELPDWVIKENEKKLPDAYMSKDWNTLLPISKYTLSTADNEDFEGNIPGETTPTFPHKLSQITKGKYEVFKYTPFASSYTFDMAKQAVKNEELGMGNFADMLAISISSTDYMGHTFGPNSIEAEDTYLRLDRDIADFLSYLDAQLGRGNYLLFLTADHGVVNVPGFLEEHNVPAGTFNTSLLISTINKMLSEKYGLSNGIIAIENNQVYMNNNEINNSGKNKNDVENYIISYLKTQPYIENAFSTENIATQSMPAQIKERLINGYNPKRSGEIGFFTKPAFTGGGTKGTTHGAWNPYDAHIPLLWFGYNIKPGKTNREVNMTDIAPTLSAILKIQMPNGSIGKVIEEITK
ncbi:alkaline phosphatase family protein [Ginsengibacter hankyongi]|uniref:Alkaline phosphatase family protein n=1 Tax=Ginsengibacter hankyongi TaxID=2607284 RepID=A0A5J5IJI5_9BACT|nr:alkaline phosphatase PafA [Ginsengibacter hankyongi]KAA9039159.1 alkaline phosphatase family protein [Ginsengibacter hankyongi]